MIDITEYSLQSSIGATANIFDLSSFDISFNEENRLLLAPEKGLDPKDLGPKGFGPKGLGPKHDKNQLKLPKFVFVI